jgi:CheY-like chemotaxis protein
VAYRFSGLSPIGTLPVEQGATMKSVLVIEDNDEVRSVVAAILTQAGYAVHQAGSGRDGILTVLAQRPDLILCEVQMPGMDGYRTLAAIRKFRNTAAIPFILMTGSTARSEFRRAMACGADDYLMKPFSSKELIASVESRLARQTHMQSDAFQQIERLRELGLPRFTPQSALTCASVAVAA